MVALLCRVGEVLSDLKELPLALKQLNVKHASIVCYPLRDWFILILTNNVLEFMHTLGQTLPNNLICFVCKSQPTKRYLRGRYWITLYISNFAVHFMFFIVVCSFTWRTYCCKVTVATNMVSASFWAQTTLPLLNDSPFIWQCCQLWDYNCICDQA